MISACLHRAKRKREDQFSHGYGAKTGRSLLEAWDEEDSMIMAWLWNTMTPEIISRCMFFATAKDIWEAIQQTYSKARNAA